MTEWIIHLIEMPEEMTAVEDLQRLVWAVPDIEIVPKDILLAAVHNGGLAIGAFVGADLVGLSFGFPGIYSTPDGPRLKHHSHMLAVHPDWRAQGIGFALKRAQWQMVRKQGIDRITWTYDPLLSRNAHLNIARLGAVCSTYLPSEYGEMHDGLNAGLPSDRLQVDWWINTERVRRRLSRRSRPALTIEHYRLAKATLLEAPFEQAPAAAQPPQGIPALSGHLLLIEIPFDFLALKAADLPMARAWRIYTQAVFTEAFATGFLVTDFIHAKGRSFYVLTHGETTL
jgi:predicted GNAT superfamily acetyltransferase